MTAAPALTSGVSSPAPVRPAEGRRAEQSDGGFKDALDSAARSHDTGSSESSRASEASDRMSANDNDAGDSAERDGDGNGQESAADGASGLSLMLAALAGASQSSDASSEFLDAASQQAVADAAAAAQAAGESGEAGPVLPGQVGEDETSLDSEQLLALLKSSAASSAGADATGASGVEDMKVKVAGQETHLALERTSPEVLTALSEAQAAAADKATQEGQPTLAKAASESAAAASARTRAAETGEKPAASTESAAAKTFGTLAPGDGSVSGALAEQGVAGREGGQGDNRNSSNSNSQQGNNAFATAINGAAVGVTGAVRGAADSADGYDPVSEQIAAGVRAELKADGLGEASSDGVLKVLHIELKPANLGSVTVRIALKDNTVSVHLETQRRDTLAAIDRERDALMSALTSAGYTVDGITTAPQSDAARSVGSTSAFMDNGSSASQGGFQGPFSQGQGLGNSSGGQGRQGQAFTDNQPFGGSDSKDNGGTGAQRGTDALYV